MAIFTATASSARFRVEWDTDVDLGRVVAIRIHSPDAPPVHMFEKLSASHGTRSLVDEPIVLSVMDVVRAAHPKPVTERDVIRGLAKSRGRCYSATAVTRNLTLLVELGCIVEAPPRDDFAEAGIADMRWALPSPRATPLGLFD